jgi:MFS family permease
MTSVADVRPSAGWYHGWNIVLVCVLCGIAANALPINAFSLFLQGWSTQLHVSVSTLQLGIAACGLGSSLGAPLAGMVVDRYPARSVLTFGLTGMAIFCLGISLVDRLWEYLLLYAVVLPVSLVCSTSMVTNAVVSRWFVRRLGLALGITSFGLGMAGVVMPPIVAVAMPVLGWRVIWRIGAALIAFVALPLVLLVIRQQPDARDGLHYMRRDGVAPAAATHHAHGGGGTAGGDTLRWKDILSRRNFWLLVLCYLPMLALYGGVGNNLTPIATSRGLTAEAAGLMLSAYSLSQLVAILAAGMLSDKFGNRLPLAGLSFLTAAGGATVALGHGFATILVGAMLAGVGGSFWPLLAAAIAVEFSGRGFGRAFGALMFFMPVMVLSPFFVAKSQEASGSYVPALATMAILAALGGVAILFLRERHGGHVTPAEEGRVGDAVLGRG